MTNQKSKRIRDDAAAIERLKIVRKPVSLAMETMKGGKLVAKKGGEYLALWSHRFSEIKEVKTIGERILRNMKGKDSRRPGDLKEELNSEIWNEFRHPTTPEGRVVAEAIQRSGFGVVDVDGVSVLRALTSKELRARGLRFEAGQGWIKRGI